MAEKVTRALRTFRFVVVDDPALVKAAEAEREADKRGETPNPHRGSIERLEEFRAKYREMAARLTFQA